MTMYVKSQKFAFVVVFLAGLSALTAQTFTSSLTGIVSDPSGTAVPGASVELKNTATNDVRRTTSSANGSYQFTNLQPGTYEISAQASGFKSFVRRDMVLQASTAASLNIPLEIGAI